MPRPDKVTVAAIQCPLGDDLAVNVERVLGAMDAAGAKGAQVVLAPELFEGPYFCRQEEAAFFELARPVQDHPTVGRVAAMAKKYGFVAPVSFFEQDGPHFYNSIAMINTDGTVMGIYRKSHIPDGPGYEEKFYFRPGNTGFKVWPTPFGVIGVGICWDQWFPEAARAMMLQGADMLLYPTAIGSEPQSPDLDTRDMWQRAMIGHAVSNIVPVVAANRVGNEGGQVFYGSSFITNQRGDKVAEASRTEATVLTATLDLREARQDQAAFGFFRDRRPQLYGKLVED